MKFNWNGAISVVAVLENDVTIPSICGDGYEVVRTETGYDISLVKGDYAEPEEPTAEVPGVISDEIAEDVAEQVAEKVADEAPVDPSPAAASETEAESESAETVETPAPVEAETIERPTPTGQGTVNDTPTV
jgi:hypothetical protein